MSENDGLISKKQLLEKYHISYGALYRWKRKGLIPDEWFIKQSTVTGQETFFPKKLVCERVELILSMKEDVLLDDLAKKLSGEEKTNTVLIISSEYGEKKFYAADICSASIVSSDGTVKDITQLILNLLKGEG